MHVSLFNFCSHFCLSLTALSLSLPLPLCPNSHQFDLYVHGDMSIEKVREGQAAELVVEGTLTTERVNFREIAYSADALPTSGTDR
jgi:hypothetical protein